MEAINFEIVTKEVSIVANDIPRGQFTVAPQIIRNTGELEDGRVFTEIILKIENTEEKPFPVNLTVRMIGIFEKDNIPENSLKDFLEVQAVQIILPYVRALVTNLTSAAFMPPLVLPVFDVRSLFAQNNN